MDSTTAIDVVVRIVQLICAGFIVWGGALAMGFGRRRDDFTAPERGASGEATSVPPEALSVERTPPALT